MYLDVLEPIAASAILIPDFNAGDWGRAIDAMWQVNCVASQVLAGERPADDLLDAVQSAGADPDAYAVAAIARLEAAIVNDIVNDIDPSEALAYARY